MNPWAGLSRREVDRGGNAAKRPFTDDEIKVLLSGPAKPTLRDMMLLAALTGMRQAEIGNLKVRDAEGGVFVVTKSKTTAGERSVPSQAHVYEVEGAVGELAANLLRVIAGGGAPHLVVQQIVVCSAVLERYMANHNRWPSPDDILAALDDGLGGYQPKHGVFEGAGQEALHTIISGSLRMSAAGICPNATERSKALVEIQRGSRELREARASLSAARP